MTKIIPYTEFETEKHDNGYRFNWLNDQQKKYITTIIIDGLNDDLLIEQTCSCQDYQFRKRECKHIKCAKNILRQFNINWRENGSATEQNKIT
jgi:hypothetical protein